MRFTDAQVALFRAGISFVHMAPTESRQMRAYAEFRRELEKADIGFEEGYGFKIRDGNLTAHFMLCVMQGASSEHVPVMFVDGEIEEFPQPRALMEAVYIPAAIDGIGPMIVR
jgi:hypothetical protein